MKQSQHTRAVLAETLPGRRAAMGHGIAAQPRGDVPGASEDAATASARGPCPAVRDAGISRAAGDLCTPSPTQTILRAESREPPGCVMSRLSTPGPGAPFARQGHRGPLPPRGSLLRRRLRSLGHHARATALALAALAVLALAVPEQAEAQTVVTFISNSARLATNASNPSRATAFTTGGNSGGYELSSVDIYVSAQTISGTVTPQVEIYEDNAGNPGTLHATPDQPRSVNNCLKWRFRQHLQRSTEHDTERQHHLLAGRQQQCRSQRPGLSGQHRRQIDGGHRRGHGMEHRHRQMEG